MVAHGILPAIPRADPYSFTATGHEWVVQSWFAEAAVGWAHRLGGEHAVTLMCGLAMGGLAWLVASLARTGRPARTAVAAGAALLVGVPLWAPRPLLAGLLCLGLTVLVVERSWSPWWLVPIVWVWVNSHGSFPLGLAWLLVVAAGAWIDDRTLGDLPRYLVGFGVGLAAAAVNPLGPKMLSFPLTALSKREVFSRVVEWKSPDFHGAEGTVILVGLAVSFAVVVRARLAWRDVLPVALFLALGLLAERNLTVLSIVLAPVLGRALCTDVPRQPMDAGLFRSVTVAMTLAAVVVGVVAVQEPLVDASTYPVQAVRWLEDHHRFAAPHRVVTEDTAANYLELLHGPRAEVFIDDRVDMFPLEVTRDYLAMLDGTDRGIAALDRWKADTVLWRSEEPLAQRLVAEGEWAVAVRRAAWVVLVRRAD
ncbi:MAG: hypothetical protein QOI61_1751 [Actinomycetota bacterium]